MKKIYLSLMILGVLISGFANEILDAEITKIERENSSLAQHDLNVSFLYDNMDCYAEMEFKKDEISSKDFFCKGESGQVEFYSEFPSLLNQKHKYILINKMDKIKVKDLNSVKFSDLAIEKF